MAATVVNNYNNEEVKTDNVRIANDVIANIACMAAMEVKGVAFLTNNNVSEMITKLVLKNAAKGIKIEVDDNCVFCEMSFCIEFGYSIPIVSKQVQDRVAAAIKDMTGLTVEAVNVHVVGINTSNV